MLTEVIKKKDMSPNRGREMIDFVRTCFNVSVRRACRGVPAPRSTYHYQSIRPDQAMLRKRIREIADYASTLWLPACPHIAETRGLAGEHQARATTIQF